MGDFLKVLFKDTVHSIFKLLKTNSEQKVQIEELKKIIYF